MGYHYGWRPYVPVAARRAQARRKMDSLRKKGVDIHPVEIEGRKIARTFWGKGWCDQMESFHDYSNRLPRGRTYVRNGSVCHLTISKGEIKAMVSGSELYNVSVQVRTLEPKKWKDVKRRCAGQIGSLIELIRGDLSDQVMAVVADPTDGLFPRSREISFRCDCPDWAVMCKHVAAVLYGVGARLDKRPELLFTLRGVNQEELIDADAELAVSKATSRGKSKRLAPGDLSDVFGIDITPGNSPPTKARASKKKKVAKKKVAKKKAVKKKAVKKKAVKKKAVKKKAVKKKAVKKKAVKKKAVKKKVVKKKAVKKKAVKKKAVKKKAVKKKAVKKKAVKKKVT